MENWSNMKLGRYYLLQFGFIYPYLAAKYNLALRTYMLWTAMFLPLSYHVAYCGCIPIYRVLVVWCPSRCPRYGDWAFHILHTSQCLRRGIVRFQRFLYWGYVAFLYGAGWAVRSCRVSFTHIQITNMASEGITKLNDELLDLNMCFDEDSRGPNKIKNTPLTSMMIDSQHRDTEGIVNMHKVNLFINSKVLHFNIQSLPAQGHK